MEKHNPIYHDELLLFVVEEVASVSPLLMFLMNFEYMYPMNVLHLLLPIPLVLMMFLPDGISSLETDTFFIYQTCSCKYGAS